jgi:hypothetical protein
MTRQFVVWNNLKSENGDCSWAIVDGMLTVKTCHGSKTIKFDGGSPEGIAKSPHLGDRRRSRWLNNLKELINGIRKNNHRLSWGGRSSHRSRRHRRTRRNSPHHSPVRPSSAPRKHACPLGHHRLNGRCHCEQRLGTRTGQRARVFRRHARTGIELHQHVHIDGLRLSDRDELMTGDDVRCALCGELCADERPPEDAPIRLIAVTLQN